MIYRFVQDVRYEDDPPETSMESGTDASTIVGTAVCLALFWIPC